MKNNKVLYILNSPTIYGGASKSFLNMLDGLIEKGIIPFVVLPKNGGLCDEFSKRNIQFQILPYTDSINPPFVSIKDSFLFVPRLLRTLYINSKMLKQLLVYIEDVQPDIIHTNVGTIHLGFSAAKKLKIPHVWHIREYQTLDFEIHPLPTMKSLVAKINDQNNYPIAITHGIFNYFSMDDSARIIYNPVFVASATQFNVNKDKYFLFAGRLTIRKGINNLVNAFIDFAKIDSEYSLHIAGKAVDVHNEEILKSMIENAGISDRVYFLGERDDLNDLMSHATALIVPSVYEGFGRITAEAMFNGCLVIGNNTAGTKEIIEPENLGILYTGHDQLVLALKKVVENKIESYFPLIMKAQERAVALYSQEQNVDSVYKLYNEIISNQV